LDWHKSVGGNATAWRYLENLVRRSVSKPELWISSHRWQGICNQKF